MATSIPITGLPVLPSGSIAGGDALPVVDISDLTDPGGTTKQTTVDGIVQYTNIYSGVFNVKGYGAIGNGVADDTAAIQAAIAAAQAFIPTPNAYVIQAPVVYLPSGQYKTTSSLVITKPVRLQGTGPESTVIIGSGVINAPIVLIQPTQAQSTYCTYDISKLGISGRNVDFTIRDGQDGIQVSATSANDVTCRIVDCRIIGCTGNGINIDQLGNSTQIIRTITEVNSEAGILMGTGTTGFSTNFLIDGCFSRENRRGIWLKGTSGAQLNSGRVRNCLLESNIKGTTGTVQSADRPCVGLQMDHCAGVHIDSNYAEYHCNDIYFGSICTYNVIKNNYLMQSAAYNLPQIYGGPAVRQLGVYITDGFGNVFDGNLYGSIPARPVSCTTTNWNTGSFGDTYVQVTDLTGADIFVNERSVAGTIGKNAPAIGVTNPTNSHIIVQQVGLGGHNLGENKYIKQHAWVFPTSNLFIGDAGMNKNLSSGALWADNHALIDAGAKYTRTVNDGVAAAFTFEEVNTLGILSHTYTNGATSYRWSFGSAAPTTGAHNVGDKVYNSAPAASGVSYWTCVTAGTPGTWVAIYIPGAAALASTNVTLNNGAAAALGTLTNAPAAGNPTKWIPINDNGTTRYIPAW